MYHRSVPPSPSYPLYLYGVRSYVVLCSPSTRATPIFTFWPYVCCTFWKAICPPTTQCWESTAVPAGPVYAFPYLQRTLYLHTTTITTYLPAPLIPTLARLSSTLCVQRTIPPIKIIFRLTLYCPAFSGIYLPCVSTGPPAVEAATYLTVLTRYLQVPLLPTFTTSLVEDGAI